MKWKTMGMPALGILFLGVLLAAVTAQAEYLTPSGEAAGQTGDSFRKTVDPRRFRKGNPDWDTQELIAGGLTALHEEHLRMFKEIEELKSELARLKKQP